MKNIVLITTILMLCGLFATLRGTPSTQRAAPVAVPTSTPLQPAATADDAQGCDGNAISEDAASCADGGWHATGTCCATTIVTERWTRGSSAKCCGPCFTQ